MCHGARRADNLYKDLFQEDGFLDQARRIIRSPRLEPLLQLTIIDIADRNRAAGERAA